MARKNAAAVALGKRRMKLITSAERAELGRKGGKAKVPKGLAKLTAKRRREIAQKAARARWGKKEGKQ